MASVVLIPPSTTNSGPLLVTVNNVQYSLYPGVAKYIPQEHYAAVKTAVAAAYGNVPTTAEPTLVINVAGAATVTYQLVASNGNGDGIPSANATSAVAAAGALTDNTLSWGTVQGVTQWKVIRTVGGTTTGLIATLPGTTTTFRDQNAAGSVYTPSAVAIGQGAALTGPQEM